MLAIHSGDEVLTFLHHILQVVVAALLFHFGIAGVAAAETSLTCPIAEIQSRKTFQVGLGDDHFFSVF